ncbi:MAG: hypothetical protein A2942_02800 [Candidatus Lloydbacteria bacterium RIFCSPLOWO2_01_FULL_50_20]|uniref:Uncharacterized protein n=1 Tax=Candidatus Lloydbacteria bacterium RIFCSPLOWO2_01_FULL_50_20 TaxID=1798665 RepID=A0A1G2DKA4_9BACT|nr:MAG: hypothetical protein A2942_02800 [Candidatus Lloydbacteria bacterium RIFCSPLOWO2_01_FULL_50_20]
MSNVSFARNLVKGKIAETLFAQMLRETGHFTVLEFGYEKIVPELVSEGFSEDKGTLETLRTSPDFAVINKVTKEVRLIEVKYQHVLNQGYVYRYAHRMSESWNPSFLFIATNEGFYFDDVKTICENEGKISSLEHPHIPKELQEQYLQILRDFEGGN